MILLRKKRVRHSLSLEVKLEVPYLKQIEKGEHNVDIQQVMCNEPESTDRTFRSKVDQKRTPFEKVFRL